MKILDTYSQQARGVAYDYDVWAATYDRDVEEFYTYQAPAMVVKAACEFAPVNSATILDLATGTGRVLESLRHTFHDAAMTGLDISRNMLDKARSKYITRDLHICDIEADAWPAADHSVDIVTCAGALSMIGDLDHVLSETSRVLKSDGVASMSFLVSDEFSKSMGADLRDRFTTYRRSPEAMIGAVHRSGFTVLKPVEQFTGYAGSTFSERHGVIAFRPL